jgi:hypothetical protein
MTKKRRRPAPARKPAARNRTSAYQFSRDPHEPVTAEDRLDAKVLAEAQARGFRLATRCTRCGQWVVAPTSVRLHMGPVCRKRVME